MIRTLYILSFSLCLLTMVRTESSAKEKLPDVDPIIENLEKSRIDADGGDAALQDLLGGAKLVAKADAAAIEAAAVMGRPTKAGRKMGKTQQRGNVDTVNEKATEKNNEEELSEEEIPLSQKVDPELGFANTLTANGEETFSEAERGRSAEGESVKAGSENQTGESETGPTAAATSDGERHLDAAKLNEKEIPVLTSDKKEAKRSGSLVQRAAVSAGVLLILLIGATWGLKSWSSRSAKGKSSQKIKILTQHFIGPKKSIAIIQVAGESLLIGVTDHSINLLKTLSLLDEEIPEEVPTNFNLSLTGSNFVDEEVEVDAPKSKKRNGRSLGREADDFAMRGLAEIRDTVSRRLKGMKEI